MVLVGVVLRRPSSVRREAVMDELPREVGRASRREETRTWVARRRERGRHRRPVWKSKRRLDAAVAASARWREGLHNNLTHWLTSAQPGTSRDTPSPRARSRRPPRRAARRSRGTTTDPSARSGSTWIKCGSRPRPSSRRRAGPGRGRPPSRPRCRPPTPLTPERSATTPGGRPPRRGTVARERVLRRPLRTAS